MRILLVTQHFPPEEGAHANRWGWLARAIAERGHELDVVVPYWRRDLAELVHEPGVRVHRVRPLVHGLGLPARAANEVIVGTQSLVAGMRQRADVVVATVPALAALPTGMLLARAKRVPLVLDLRDPWPELFDNWAEWGDYGSGHRPHKGRWDALRAHGFTAVARAFALLRSRADAVTVTTESFADFLRTQGLDDVHVVRNTIPVTSGEPLGRTNGGHDDGLHVLYLGNIGRSQYLATAIRAAALCRESGVRVCLRIVGHGAHEAGLKVLAQRLEAPVEFLPRVPRAEARPHYEWADTVLVSLRDWEQFSRTVPSKLYDALWSGRHVSGSLTGEAATIVAESGAGDVVPPQDPEALAVLWGELAADPARLRTDGAGPAWVKHNADRDALGARFCDVLEEVVARG